MNHLEKSVKLEELSHEMRKFGENMIYFAGFDPEEIRHGQEMLGAAEMASRWAKHYKILENRKKQVDNL